MAGRNHSVSAYLIVFVVLMALTGLTMLVAAVPLGRWHTAAALIIAALKAALVILYFMHALDSGRLTALVIVGGLTWLAILIGMTLSDYLTRLWLV